MDRRTDRTVGIAAITAMAIVPAVLLAAIQVGGDYSPGQQAQAQASPALEDFPGAPRQEKTFTCPPGSPKGEKWPYCAKTAAPSGQPGSPGSPGSPGGPGAPPPPGAQPPGTRPPQGPKLPGLLNAYTRTTDTGLVASLDGSRTLTHEIANIRLKPAFSMDVVTYHRTQSKGQRTPRTTKIDRMRIKGQKKSTKLGSGKWRTVKISKSELAQLRLENDPRVLTQKVKDDPSTKRSRDKFGQNVYVVDFTVGPALTLIPEQLRRGIPFEFFGLGMKATLFSDKADHPHFFAAHGATPLGLAGIGIGYSNLR